MENLNKMHENATTKQNQVIPAPENVQKDNDRTVKAPGTKTQRLPAYTSKFGLTKKKTMRQLEREHQQDLIDKNRCFGVPNDFYSSEGSSTLE